MLTLDATFSIMSTTTSLRSPRSTSLRFALSVGIVCVLCIKC
ncbi:hypothetical protein LINPERHAP1_LOCUS5960 [Linum perenne]